MRKHGPTGVSIISSMTTAITRVKAAHLNFPMTDTRLWGKGKDSTRAFNLQTEILSNFGQTLYVGDQSDALNKTGRPMLYSLCNWGEVGILRVMHPQ